MKKLRGFTLIELVIVIAILAILAAVAIPKFVDLSKKARVATAEAELGALRAAANLYYASTAVKGGVAGFPQRSSTLFGYLQKGPTQLYCPGWTGCDQLVTATSFEWYYSKGTGKVWKKNMTTSSWSWGL